MCCIDKKNPPSYKEFTAWQGLLKFGLSDVANIHQQTLFPSILVSVIESQEYIVKGICYLLSS